MTAAERLLGKLVAWATGDPGVRRLVLVGSRARAEPLDELADIDVQAYVEAKEPYIEDHGWLSGIGKVWVYVRDEYTDGDIHVPTRLVIFDRGVKVDFAFYPAEAVSFGVRGGLPHRVLVDKGAPGGPRGATSSPPGPPEPPGEPDFRRVVEEFWFEIYHVAKYLARDEPWLAKSRDWATKRFLLSMIDWHERIVRRAPEPDAVGRRSGVSPDTWEELHGTFAGLGREESWSAVLATMSLFRRLATQVAATAEFEYPADVDENISGFVLSLRAAGASRRDEDTGPAAP